MIRARAMVEGENGADQRQRDGLVKPMGERLLKNATGQVDANLSADLSPATLAVVQPILEAPIDAITEKIKSTMSKSSRSLSSIRASRCSQVYGVNADWVEHMLTIEDPPAIRRDVGPFLGLRAQARQRTKSTAAGDQQDRRPPAAGLLVQGACICGRMRPTAIFGGGVEESEKAGNAPAPGAGRDGAQACRAAAPVVGDDDIRTTASAASTEDRMAEQTMQIALLSDRGARVQGDCERAAGRPGASSPQAATGMALYRERQWRPRPVRREQDWKHGGSGAGISRQAERERIEGMVGNGDTVRCYAAPHMRPARSAGASP